MNDQNTTSQMQLQFALALVILGYKERVENETHDLQALDQKIAHLQDQRTSILTQRTLHAEYLALSVRQMFPDVNVFLSSEGELAIPAKVLDNLLEVQHTQQQMLLEPVEQNPKRVTIESERSVPSNKQMTDEAVQQATTLSPDATRVLEYVFSQPGASFSDWKTTVQSALSLPQPPKIKGYKTYRELQQAAQILGQMHRGDLASPSAALNDWYSQYFVEGERWSDFVDTMNEWKISLS